MTHSPIFPVAKIRHYMTNSSGPIRASQLLSFMLNRMPLRLIPKPLLPLFSSLSAHAINHCEDRAYLRDVIIPELLSQRPQKVLFIGVQLYTKQYEQLMTKAGCEFWTIDRDPESKICGSAHHCVYDITQAADPDDPLKEVVCDLIVCNGVFGFGVDNTTDRAHAFLYMRRHLSHAGRLLVGWNKDRTSDLMEDVVVRQHYRHCDNLSIPNNISFASSSHCYDLLEAV